MRNDAVSTTDGVKRICRKHVTEKNGDMNEFGHEYTERGNVPDIAAKLYGSTDTCT